MARRDPKTLEFDGEVKTLGEWAREYDIPPSVLHNRLTRGWSAFEAVTTPITGAVT